METEKDEDTSFGFAWGDNEQFTYIRHPEDGTIREVSESVVSGLTELGKGHVSEEEIDQRSKEYIQSLKQEGYFFDGPIVRLSPPENFRFWPRVIAFLVVLFISLMALLDVIPHISPYYGNVNAPVMVFAFVYVISNIFLIFHEFGHYYVTKRFVPVKVGVGTINGVLPVAKTYTTQTWLLDKKHRIWVNLAGACFELAFLLPVVAIFYAGHSSVYIYALIAAITFKTVTTNINPLYHGDGYNILSDVIGKKNIRKKGVEDFKNMCVSWYSAYGVVSYGYAVVGLLFSLFTMYTVWGIKLFIFSLSTALLFNILEWTDIGGSKTAFKEYTPGWAEEIQSYPELDDDIFDE